MEKLNRNAVITFNMSFALAAMLTVFLKRISLILMPLAYLFRPVNINAFITFAKPEEEMTNLQGRSIVDAFHRKSIRVLACTGIRCTRVHRHWLDEINCIWRSTAMLSCVAMHCARVCASSEMTEDLRPGSVIEKRFRSHLAKETIGAETTC